MEVRGKRVLVVGLGRSGRAAAVCLAKRGAIVTVTDQRPPAAFKAEISELMPYKAGLELGAHREASFFEQDLVVVSPGVPWDMPLLVAARERRVRVVPEIELASWYLTQPILGITGSNGKTTTTTLVGKILEASGFATFVGGNIGVPLISAVDTVPADAWLVTELSSFQLEGIETFRPRLAVLLNLSRNHLDRHPSFEAYVAAKARIFQNQRADDFTVLNADDENVMRLRPSIAARKIFFSRRQVLPEGVFVSKGALRYRVGNLERALLEIAEIPLRGAYNVENAAAAAAAAATVGADFDALRRTVKRFRGVEHRLEFVREIRKVQFFNDSKATSVDATAKSLSAFERGVHLILGGKDKGAPYAPLRPLLRERVREVLVIGAAAEKIAQDLAGAAEIVRAGTLETAVGEAFMRASPGDVVLLAPACSSYDQFQDFEHRGRAFKELVERLARDVEAVPLELRPRNLPRAESRKAAPKADANPRKPTEPSASAGGRSMSQAGQTPGRVTKASAPSHQPVKPAAEQPAARPSAPKSPEWRYVYEVSAEEYAPPQEGLPQEHDHGLETQGEEAERPAEELTDASMPFEVREDTRASGASPVGVEAPGKTKRRNH
jgi:UDP-N-acetylmuramoylalanine--D-glutamate ligase